MKRKVYSTVMIGFGTVASVAAPVALAVSCGGSGNSGNPYKGVDYAELALTNDLIAKQVENEQAAAADAANTTIKFGVRQSEVAVYQALADKFNTFGKGHVEIEPADQTRYETQAATGQLPDVFWIDANSDAVKNSKWVKPIDIDSFTNANGDLYNVDTTGKEVNFNEAGINQGHLKFVSNDNGVNFALPMGYTSNAIIMNFETVDTSKKIHSFAPADTDSYDASLVAHETEFSEAQGANGVGECTYDGIQDYFSGAGVAPTAGTAGNSTPDGNWLGYGPGNVMQRIYSVGRSCQYDGLDLPITAMKERLTDTALWAAANVQIDGKPWYNTETDTIDEDVFVKGVDAKNPNAELMKYLWNSIFGYMNPAGFGTALSIGGNATTTGEVEPIYNKQAMMNFNAKWAYKMIEGSWSGDRGGLATIINTEVPTKHLVWADNGHAASSGQLALFASPYDVAKGDSYAINRDSSDAQSLVAKRFLKFINQVDPSFAVTYDEPVEGGAPMRVTKTPGMAITYKTVASVGLINQKQVDEANNFVPDATADADHKAIATKSASAWFRNGRAGDQESAEYNGIGGTMWTKFDPSYWSIMDKAFYTDMQDLMSGENDRGMTYAEYVAKFKEVATKFQREYSL